MVRRNKDRLTDLMKRFVDEFLIDFNPAAAALRAGYSPYSIQASANTLLKKDKIQRAIKKRQKELQDKLEITQERVLQEYAKIAFVNPKLMYEEDGNLKKITDMDDDVAASISGFKVRELLGHEIVTEVKRESKKGALDSLSRHLGLFEKDNKLTLEFSLDKLLRGLPEEVRELLKEELTKIMARKQDNDG